jgi:hypothetical protein
MARKISKINQEKLEAKKRLEEIERLEQEALLEEVELKKSTEDSINKLCEKSGLFCGVILTPKDLAAIVELAVISKENVKIGFQLYFKEE